MDHIKVKHYLTNIQFNIHMSEGLYKWLDDDDDA
jgi:hypothetical protein